LVLNAIGSQHFYAMQVDDVLQWIEACPHLTMYVVAVNNGRRLGCLTLDLQHVIKNRVELHHFEVPVRGLHVAVNLMATVGFTEGAAFDLEHVDLKGHTSGLVYSLPSGVVVPEVLPNSWLAFLTGCGLLLVPH
jgi:hypothetical protein